MNVPLTVQSMCWYVFSARPWIATLITSLLNRLCRIAKYTRFWLDLNVLLSVLIKMFSKIVIQIVRTLYLKYLFPKSVRQHRTCSTWWRHQMETFPRYWPFVRWIHRSPVNSPHKGQWRGALMFSSICAWMNSRVNNREAGDLRCHRAHYDVIVMRLDNSVVYCTGGFFFFKGMKYMRL